MTLLTMPPLTGEMRAGLFIFLFTLGVGLILTGVCMLKGSKRW